MNDVDDVVNAISLRLLQILDFVLSYLADFESMLREQMIERGVSPLYQTIIMFSVAVIVTLFALRFLQGFFRLVIALFGAVIAVHLVLPLVQ
jgi:hypothetical protein